VNTTYNLKPVDVTVLRRINKFRYLTAAQLNRVLWPNNTRDANRYAQRRLAKLAQRDYVQVLTELPKPSTGSAPKVYTLAWRGRKALQQLGDAVPSYYRPSEVGESAHNGIFMPHTLAVVDVLVSVQRLVEEVPSIRLTQLLLERTLRQLRPQVTVPALGNGAQRRVSVVPDALFSLTDGDGPAQHFLVELDRGTERQQAWRDKVAALTLWVASPASAQLVPSQYVTVMVVTTDGPNRREYLRSWTAAELQARDLHDEYGSIFAITDSSAVTTAPVEFFGGTHWYPPFRAVTPESLIDLPARDRGA
jgi:protein involved in plasmid replication-relaxation